MDIRTPPAQLASPKPAPRGRKPRRWIRRRRTLGACRREAKASGEVEPDTWAAILDFYGYRCALCEAQPWEHQGHVVALARGGPHAPENVFPLCRRCNYATRTRTVWPRRRHPWMPE